jgi:hypothetical protein
MTARANPLAVGVVVDEDGEIRNSAINSVVVRTPSGIAKVDYGRVEPDFRLNVSPASGGARIIINPAGPGPRIGNKVGKSILLLGSNIVISRGKELQGPG